VKRFLVVGGSGFVGGNVARLASKKWGVAVIGSRPRTCPEAFTYLTVDITKREELLAVLEEEKPDAVVNAAAVSNIDFAERNRELAWNVNVLGARNVAEGCSLTGAKYVFFSSDAVFSGAAGMYREGDEPDPVNFYGKTKAEAEKAVLSLHGDTAVIRVSLVLGYPVGYPLAGGNAFYLPLEESLGKGAAVPQPMDEIRTPVDVITLAEASLELAENDFHGIIHVGSTGSVSRYELARLAARAMGYSPDLITPMAQEPGSGRAPRHKNGVICVELAGRILKTRMLGVEESVRRSVSERL
jgi:dTDP-4-dehydrorhamnose reductase